MLLTYLDGVPEEDWYATCAEVLSDEAMLDCEEVRAYLGQLEDAGLLDLDLDGEQTALGDGLMLMRYMSPFDEGPDSLCFMALSEESQRSCEEVFDYLECLGGGTVGCPEPLSDLNAGLVSCELDCPEGFASEHCDLPPETWCPRETATASVGGSGGTVELLDVEVQLDDPGWSGVHDLHVAVHGAALNFATPADLYPNDVCEGSFIELLPVEEVSGQDSPSGVIHVPCGGAEYRTVEHARLDGTFATDVVYCDSDTDRATFEFTGFGRFLFDDSTVPGCEECPLGSPLAVCDVESWWPPRGECYTAPNDFVEAEIGPGGGSLTHPSGATLVVPAGALAEPRTFSLDIAWEKLPRQRLGDGGNAPWRVLTAERDGWSEEWGLPGTLTFPCGLTDGLLLVEHQYD